MSSAHETQNYTKSEVSGTVFVLLCIHVITSSRFIVSIFLLKTLLLFSFIKFRKLGILIDYLIRCFFLKVSKAFKSDTIHVK